jgi:hypothetical protein
MVGNRALQFKVPRPDAYVPSTVPYPDMRSRQQLGV